MIKEKCRGAVDPAGDVAAGCFISGGFAGAPLESAGFLLFFYPQPNSLPCPAPFLSPPLSPHSTQSPLLTGSSVISGTTHSSLLSTLLRNIHSLFLILCWDIFLATCVFWKWPRGRDFSNAETVKKGREVKRGEENSWLLFLSWSRSLGIAEPFHPSLSLSLFSQVPRLRANGKAALCLPECSQCIQFPVQRAWARKTKTDGYWRKREVGGDWGEGLKGTDGKWGGGCVCMGGVGGEWWNWKTHMVLVTNCYAFHVFTFSKLYRNLILETM